MRRRTSDTWAAAHPEHAGRLADAATLGQCSAEAPDLECCCPGRPRRLPDVRSILEYTMPRPKGGHSVALPDSLVWLNGFISSMGAA